MTDLTDLLRAIQGADGPSRALDCEIAVLLDGFWIEPPRHDGGEDRYAYKADDGGTVLPGQGGDMLVPEYSRNQADAWRLLYRVMARRGGLFTVRTDLRNNGPERCRFHASAEVTIPSREYQGHGYSSEAEHAQAIALIGAVVRVALDMPKGAS